MNEKITPGEYINLIRRRKQLTIVDISALSSVSIATISRIEADRPALFANVCAIARALDIPIAKLEQLSRKDKL